MASDASGPLETIEVRLPRSGTTYRITRPIDIDRLIDEMQHDPEEILPHWAEIWPSGIALADEVLSAPGIVRSKRVLELGCGLGTTAIAALQSGAVLTVTDYATGALELCRVNTIANARREPAQRQVNWRKPSDSFLAQTGDGFPVVLAADVLYEARDIQPLLDLVDRIVEPAGMLWLAEPGRPIAGEFVKRLSEQGWSGDRSTHAGPWVPGRDANVSVTVHRLYRHANA